MSKYYGFKLSGFGGWVSGIEEVLRAGFGGFVSNLHDISSIEFDDDAELRGWVEEIRDDYCLPEEGDLNDFAEEGSLVVYDSYGNGWDSPTWFAFCWVDENTYEDYKCKFSKEQELLIQLGEERL